MLRAGRLTIQIRMFEWSKRASLRDEGAICPMTALWGCNTTEGGEAKNARETFNCPPGTFNCPCEGGMMCGTAENRVLEWRGTAAVCQNGGEKWVFDVCARILGGFRHDMLEFSRQI